MKYLYQFIILIFFITLTSTFVKCTNNDDNINLTGKYYDVSGLMNLDLIHISNELTGYQCYVTQNGNKIDCCLEEDGVTIKLIKNNNTFEGTMESCIDQKLRKIRISYKNKTLVLSFIEETELLLPEVLKFKLES